MTTPRPTDGLAGTPRQKLIDSKQKWAREGRLLTGRESAPDQDRLPPGQKLVTDWPVLDLGIQPAVSLADWSLAVDGLVARPHSWTWESFGALPRFEDVSDIHCVTAWSRYDNRWEGVAALHLLDLVQPLPEARHVVFHGYDGYTTNVRLDVFADDDVLLADRHDGAPLSVEHGGPLRVVIPKFYFWKSTKWVRRIEFVADDRPGFWEVRGYHNEGDPWHEERYGW